MIQVAEGGTTERSPEFPTTVTYVDHQPGDATRYEVLAVDLQGRGIHLGALGYLSHDAVIIVVGMQGEGRAAMFRRGEYVAEHYVAERLALKNEHTVHHITEIVAELVGGTVAGCTHEPRP